MSDRVCPACEMCHDASVHDVGFDWDKKLFMDGSLLRWCETLRGSSTGMSDPLGDIDVREIRAYMQRRLDRWRSPSSHWDRMVRALVEHSLRNYHAPKPESVRIQDTQRSGT